jgi:hypothetical protein
MNKKQQKHGQKSPKMLKINENLAFYHFAAAKIGILWQIRKVFLKYF